MVVFSGIERTGGSDFCCYGGAQVGSLDKGLPGILGSQLLLLTVIENLAAVLLATIAELAAPIDGVNALPEVFKQNLIAGLTAVKDDLHSFGMPGFTR